jgi:uncharacterized protein (DUF1810 family)
MPNESDPFDLQRFLDAQAPIYPQVVRELRAGHKRSHWIWFVFPQLAGLGSSAMAQRYAITSLAEARAYLGHPVLRARLLECVALVNAVTGRSITEILGPPDDLKFRSSMTLFHAAEPGLAIFQEALDKYFAGAGDPLTITNLAGGSN